MAEPAKQEKAESESQPKEKAETESQPQETPSGASKESQESGGGSLKDKLAKAVESGKKAAKAGAEKLSEKATELKEKAVESETYKKLKERGSMEGLLKQAAVSLEKYLGLDVNPEKQIPPLLMKGAKGIVLLSVIKASFGVGAEGGSGVIITKLEYDQWSGPCAVGTIGGIVGWNIGAQKTDLVIVLRDDDAVKVFSGEGQIKFSGNASLSVGTLGRDAQIAVSANDKGYAPMVSYSQSAGLYAGVELKCEGIKVRDDCNEKYYGKKLSVKEILGSAAADDVKNADYDKIVELLTNYAKQLDDKAAQEVEEDNDDSKQPI